MTSYKWGEGCIGDTRYYNVSETYIIMWQGRKGGGVSKGQICIKWDLLLFSYDTSRVVEINTLQSKIELKILLPLT